MLFSMSALFFGKLMGARFFLYRLLNRLFDFLFWRPASKKRPQICSHIVLQAGFKYPSEVRRTRLQEEQNLWLIALIKPIFP